MRLFLIFWGIFGVDKNLFGIFNLFNCCFVRENLLINGVILLLKFFFEDMNKFLLLKIIFFGLILFCGNSVLFLFNRVVKFVNLIFLLLRLLLFKLILIV